MKKVLVFNPPRVDGRPVVREERFEHKDFEVVYPPLTLLTCASQIRKHLADRVQVFFLDAMGFDLSEEAVMQAFDACDPDVVVSRFAFDVFREDLDWLSRFKNRKSGVVTITRNKIIGDVPALQERYLREFPAIDFLMLADQDRAIPGVLTAILEGLVPPGCAFRQSGEICRSPSVSFDDRIDEMPFPAYDLLPPPPWPYRSSLFETDFTLVMTSRGCPYSCSFCAYRQTPWLARSPANVVAEIRWLRDRFGIRNIVFFDDTISVRPERCLEICRLLRLERWTDLRYAICTRVDHISEKLLRAWKETGLVQLAFGVESGSDRILQNCGKGISRDRIRQAFALCRQLRIPALMLLIIGLPGETMTSIRETRRMVRRVNPYYLQYSFAVPFPNTPMYQWASSRGFLLEENFSAYNPLTLHPVMRTEDLGAKELIEQKRAAYQEFLLSLRFLLGKISLTDWAWNWRGFKMFLNRIVGLLRGYVR